MAARAYDLVALKFGGLDTDINFSLSVWRSSTQEKWIFDAGLCNIGFVTSVLHVENYHDELQKMKSMTRQEVVQDLRI